MGDDTEHAPDYTRPPIVETVIGVQFSPLAHFQSYHYGWLWREYLEDGGWTPVADEKPLPEYQERFDNNQLKLTRPATSNALKVRLKLKDLGRARTIQVQSDKFYYSWVRDGQRSPEYKAVRPEFDSLFAKFMKFSVDSGLGPVQPNLWEVTYVNQVPRGHLWSEPKDWHRVLPTLFPEVGPSCKDLRFATYQGEWYFEIEPQRGRVHLRVAKMMMGQKPDPVLYFSLTSRGTVVPGGDWGEGLEAGHAACVRLFLGITSDEAQKEWKGQS